MITGTTSHLTGHQYQYLKNQDRSKRFKEKANSEIFYAFQTSEETLKSSNEKKTLEKCAQLHENSKLTIIRYFSKNPNSGNENCFLRKTTSLDEIYGNFGKN